MDLGRPDGDRRHISAWSDAQSRAGLRAMKLGASRESPTDGGFPAVLYLSRCDYALVRGARAQNRSWLLGVVQLSLVEGSRIRPARLFDRYIGGKMREPVELPLPL